MPRIDWLVSKQTSENGPESQKRSCVTKLILANHFLSKGARHPQPQPKEGGKRV